ncbi:MAG: hypothetical protein ACI95S_001138 [Dinoroseobacter sp.]|jgi:hypothetical protein
MALSPIRVPKLKPISTWTSRPLRGLALIACFGLAACGGGFGGGGSTTASPSNPVSGLTSLFGTRPASEVTVTQNRVKIAGPEGFCVDPTGTNDATTSAFVLLGNCAAIPGSRRDAEPANPAILTASVGDNPGAAVATRLAEMDSYLRSDLGLTALSRTGNAGSVEILDSFAQDDVLFIRARDTSTASDPAMSADYWRAFFDARGSLVTLSVVGVKSNPIPPQTGLQTLQAFTALVRTRNGAATPPPVAAVAAPVDEPTPVAAPTAAAVPTPGPIWGGLRGVGFLRRLLG